MSSMFTRFAILMYLLAPVSGHTSPVQATAYQITPDHAGVTTSGGTLALQLKPLWSVTLPGAISYPIIADGGVFVTVAGLSGSTYGTQLYALAAQTGATLWPTVPLSGTYFWSNATYDDGKLFVLNYDGLLRSYDAHTGAPGWSAQLQGQYAFSSPPSASNGIVYTGGAGSGGTLYALTEATQSVVTASVANGDNSSPAIGPNGVYVSYPCQVYDFDPITLATIWHYNGPCDGGGGRTSVYANGKLYVRDWASSPPNIFDAATGNIVGSFTAGPAPAIGTTTGFFLANGTLSAVDLATNAQKWSFTGDGSLVSAPIVVDQAVIVASSSGNLYALDVNTGYTTWQAKAPAAISGPDEQDVSQPLTGLAVANGILVVPAGSTLVAYSIFGPPAPTSAVATSGVGFVQLDWSAAAGAASYNIYLGSTSGAEALTPVQSGVTGTTARITTGLVADGNSFFTIKALSPAGISAPSNEVSGQPLSVAAPSSLRGTPGTASVALAWSAVTGATGYSVYKATAPGAEASTPVLSGMTTPNATVAGLTPGVRYYFTVKAMAYAMTSASSNEVSATPSSAPPTNLVATSGASSVSLTWSASSGATSYNLYSGPSAGGESATPVLTGVSGTNATITGLTPGITYYFVARSVAGATTSAPSNEASAALPSATPAHNGSGGGGGLDALTLLVLALIAGWNLHRRLPVRPARRVSGASAIPIAALLVFATLLSGCVPVPYRPSTNVSHASISGDTTSSIVVEPASKLAMADSLARSIHKVEPRIVVDTHPDYSAMFSNGKNLDQILNPTHAAEVAALPADYLLTLGPRVHHKLHDTGAAAPFPYLPVFWVGYEKIQSVDTLCASLVDLHDPQSVNGILISSPYTEVIAAFAYGVGTIAQSESAMRQALAQDVAHALVGAHATGEIRLILLTQEGGDQAGSHKCTPEPPKRLSARADTGTDKGSTDGNAPVPPR